MQTLGLIGGIAPESTVDYYRRLIAAWRGRILINSIDLETVLGLAGARALDELAMYVGDELDRLVAAGATVGALASNTPHLVFDRLQARSPIPLVSIVEATCDAVAASGLTRVALFGTRSTMEGGFYRRDGLTIVTPNDDERTFIHDRYVGELVRGIFRGETRDGMLRILDAMIARDQVQGLILGGTELPLLLRDATVPVPMFDTTAIHVNAIVAALSR
jgi:aspartate racemase